MNTPAGLPRPRHLVLMTPDLEATQAVLRDELQVSAPFSDPIAGKFGLRNVIYSVGDTFLEVCTPLDPSSPGQRHLDRVGECGYMVIFQVPDVAKAKDRIAGLGVRQVWQGSRPGIEGIHLHPADVPGSIMSLDQATPPGSWAWGGPDWATEPEIAGENPIAGLLIEVADPVFAVRIWADVLGLPTPAEPMLNVSGTTVRFTASPSPRGLIAVDYVLPSASPTSFVASGVGFSLTPATAGPGVSR